MEKLKMDFGRYADIEADNMEYDDSSSITSTPFVNSPFVNSPFVNSPFVNSSCVNSPFINSPFVNSSCVNSPEMQRPNKDVEFTPTREHTEEEESHSHNASSCQKQKTFNYGSTGRLMKVATRKNEINSDDKFSRKKSFSRFPSWSQPDASFTIAQNNSTGRGLKRNSPSCTIKKEEQNEKRQRVEKLTETTQQYSLFGPISSTTKVDLSQEANFKSLYHEEFQVSSQCFDD